MGAEWRTIGIGEVCDGIFDGPHATPPQADTGAIFLGISSLKNGRIDITTPEYISEADYPRWTRRVTPRPNDLVFSYETRLGEAALIPEGLRCCLGRRMALMRPNLSRVDPRFLLYAYLSPEFQDVIRSRTIHGSTVNRIPLSELPRFPLNLPPLAEQREIARVLGALDDKIELNRRLNATLEGLSRAVFRSWFVDFDPVVAKAAGRRPVGMTADTAALFPSTFEETERGLIPKGWRFSTFGEIAQNIRRGISASELDENTPYLALEHMPRESICLDDWTSSAGVMSQKFRFERGEILFGKLRPYFHKVGVAPVNGVCSTDILVLAPQTEALFGPALGYASSDEIIDHADGGSTGTRMPRTDWYTLSRFDIVRATNEVESRYTQYVRPLVEKIIANIHASRTLAALRDALLPRLLSGELRLKDAERAVDEVA